MRQLRQEFPDIEFVAREIRRDSEGGSDSVEQIYNELEDLRDGLDGVLIIGTLSDYRFAFTGLPTIMVYNLFKWMNIPYKRFITDHYQDRILIGGPDYGPGRVLTAQLDRRNACRPSVSSAMFDDLVAKIRLIEAIARLRRSRILSVSPREHLAQVDYQGDVHSHLPDDYDKRYMQALKETLGTEIIRVEPEAFYKAVREADEEKAKQIANIWIDEAEEVVDTTESEVVKTAKSYLALDALRERHDCNAVSTHMRSLTGSGKTEDMFWPGLGLECGFKPRGIQAVCQDYPNILVAQLLGYFVTGRPSMLGDLMVDTFNGVDVLTHCGAPINPHGDDRVPYIIRSHAESPVRGTLNPGSSTGLQVKLPVDEPVTIWKVYVLHKKIGVHTGESVDGHSLYENLDDIMCRTKMIAKVDAAKVQKHFSPDEYGIHRTATFGDLREKIKDLATLIGFDVMEEDR
ncbi:MAG: hypothetical protein U9R48_03165 [Chloroflexota bacterium]|nr:hypothetical protein [Chloroflexota bacterium]